MLLTDLFQRIIERMRKHTLSPEELSMIKDEAAWEEAKQNAMREGHTEGHAIGLAEGLAEGQRQEKLAIARTMLANGMAVDLIATITGLPPDEISQLVAGS